MHETTFTQGAGRLNGNLAIPDELKDTDGPIIFTDSNWGPQDASKPTKNETRTVTMREL